MAKKDKEVKEQKKVEIKFKRDKLKFASYAKHVFGVEVEEVKDGVFVGECLPAIKQALLDAGKCEK